MPVYESVSALLQDAAKSELWGCMVQGHEPDSYRHNNDPEDRSPNLSEYGLEVCQHCGTAYDPTRAKQRTTQTKGLFR